MRPRASVRRATRSAAPASLPAASFLPVGIPAGVFPPTDPTRTEAA
ncbi:hypothetical protein SNARM312S_07094 [Streptomyces narbonensis]